MQTALCQSSYPYVPVLQPSLLRTYEDVAAVEKTRSEQIVDARPRARCVRRSAPWESRLDAPDCAHTHVPPGAGGSVHSFHRHSFNGTAPEPRPVPSGHIPGSVCVPSDAIRTRDGLYGHLRAGRGRGALTKLLFTGTRRCSTSPMPMVDATVEQSFPAAGRDSAGVCRGGRGHVPARHHVVRCGSALRIASTPAAQTMRASR